MFVCDFLSDSNKQTSKCSMSYEIVDVFYLLHC